VNLTPLARDFAEGGVSSGTVTAARSQLRSRNGAAAALGVVAIALGVGEHFQRNGCAVSAPWTTLWIRAVPVLVIVGFAACLWVKPRRVEWFAAMALSSAAMLYVLQLFGLFLNCVE
jgi:hypothetical protein